jgi:hypothetical protein
MDLKKPFLPQLFPLVMRDAFEYVNTPEKIPSKTLRRSLSPEFSPGDTKGALNVPYYWSYWYHFGRGPVTKGPGEGFLVWYKDPSQDPRLSRGYPLVPEQVKRLTPAQFKRDKADGKLVISKKSGKPSKNYPFFSNEAGGGMAGLTDEVDKLAAEKTNEYVLGKLKKAGLLNVTKKINIGL